jgi:enamine deaminase RidA (YjgF/YER057c/UK114 family)
VVGLSLCPALLIAMGDSTLKKHLNPEGVFKPATYSQVVTIEKGKLVVTAGIVAQNEYGEIVGKGDLRAQTEQALSNLQKVLKAAGATFSDVVKLTYYVVNYNPAQVQMIREIRAKFLDPKHLPASTLVGVQALYDPNVLIEIEAMAVVR